MCVFSPQIPKEHKWKGAKCLYVAFSYFGSFLVTALVHFVGKNYSYNYYIVSYSIFSIQDHSFPKNPQKCCSLPGGNEVSTMNAYMVQYMYTPLVAGCKHVQIRGFYVQCQTPASFSSVLATIDRAEVSGSCSGIFARSNYWTGLITGRYFLNMVEIA